jgi:hypothetical protein
VRRSKWYFWESRAGSRAIKYVIYVINMDSKVITRSVWGTEGKRREKGRTIQASSRSRLLEVRIPAPTVSSERDSTSGGLPWATVVAMVVRLRLESPLVHNTYGRLTATHLVRTQCRVEQNQMNVPHTTQVHQCKRFRHQWHYPYLGDSPVAMSAVPHLRIRSSVTQKNSPPFYYVI